MAHSTRRSSAKKPGKPRPDFPLFPHASGRWCKKIRGKFHYFGKVADDPKGKAALELWLEQKDDLLAGRVPRNSKGELTLHGLCNAFMAAKELRCESGDLTRRMFSDYRAACEFMLSVFGKSRLVSDLAASDFDRLRAAMARKYRSPSALSNRIVWTKAVFLYGLQADLLERQVRFGPNFKKPEKRIVRAAKQAKGEMTFSACEIRRLLKAASPPLRAMILLGVNCGFGNHDCGRLPLSAIDLRAGWINFPRPKTAVERRCPLWPETIAALKAAISGRPKAKDKANDQLVFITKYGEPWAKETADSPVGKEFYKLIVNLQVYRPGRGFYGLRRTYRTIADGTKDFPAVRLIMGHSDDSMDSVYRERIDDQRLVDVVSHVRRWLFRRDSPDLWRGLEGGAK